MKKRIIALLSLIFVLFNLFSCNKETGVKDVVIIPESAVMEISDNTTLLDYMNQLQNGGKIKFKISNGMVTSINGIKNTTNCYWMLYTSDENNSNTAWGEKKYNGKTFGSATAGAESLIIKENEVYIWVYQKF